MIPSVKHSCSLIRSQGCRLFATAINTSNHQKTAKDSACASLLKEYPILSDKRLLPNTYIVDEDLAQAVVEKLDIQSEDTTQWIEVNPGPGLLTTALLKAGIRNLCSIESKKDFTPRLEELKQDFGSRFIYLRKDFFRSYYIHDKSYELADSLRNFSSSSFNERPSLRIILTCGSWESENRLFMSLLHGLVKRRDSIFSLGRVQFICFMSYREYLYWTIQHPYPSKTLYRWRTAVQALFFDVETLMQVPANCFRPVPKLKIAKLPLYKSENPNMLYLVRFVPKFNLYEEILEEKFMPLFQFFLKDLLSKRGLRLIPKLDLWFPKIGYELIKHDFTMTLTVCECSPQDLLRVFKVVMELEDLEKTGFMSAFLQDHPMNAQLWKSFKE